MEEPIATGGKAGVLQIAGAERGSGSGALRDNTKGEHLPLSRSRILTAAKLPAQSSVRTTDQERISFRLLVSDCTPCRILRLEMGGLAGLSMAARSNGHESSGPYLQNLRTITTRVGQFALPLRSHRRTPSLCRRGEPFPNNSPFPERRTTPARLDGGTGSSRTIFAAANSPERS